MKKFIAVISEKREIAPQTYQISFDFNFESFTFEAGQYVEISIYKLLYPDAGGNSRFFSITSSPSQNKSISIVFKSSDSGFKKTLMELQLGSEIIVGEPAGVLSLSKNSDREIVFIAGELGILSIISMIRYEAESGFGVPITLLYTKNNDEILFSDELRILSEKNSNFRFITKNTNLDKQLILDNIQDLTNKIIYITGDSSYVESALFLLKELNVSEDNIIYEEVSANKNTVEMADNNESQIESKTFSEFEKFSANNPNIFTSQFFEVLTKIAGITITDKNGTIVYVNEYFSKIAQYSAAEMIGQNHRMLKSGLHSPSLYKEMWDTITSGRVWRGEVKNKAKDGSYYWSDSSIAPILDDKGDITNYVAIRFLITDRKEIEEELRQTIVKLEEREIEYEKVKKVTFSILEDLDLEKKAVEKKVIDRTADIEHEKNKLLQVTENMKDGAVLLDREGRAIFANTKMYEILNIQRDVSLNYADLSLDVLKNYFNNQKIEKLFQRCIISGSSRINEIDANGKIYDIFSHCLGRKNDLDKVEGCFVLISDITDMKLLERTKSDLVAVASHQLRTPLTAMRGNVEMLIDESFGTLNAQQQDLLKDIDISTARLIGMVNDMLDITKIEQGKLDLNCELVSITDIIKSIKSDLTEYADKRKVEILVDVEDNLIAYVDASRARQVLQNLIDNSIKYSREGGRLEITSCSKAGFVEVIFKDNGIGIPKVEQTKIFSRFYRASNTANSVSSGSGLGLYIVRSIVSQLGGDIFFESEEGVGTTFFVTFPVAKIETNKTEISL